MFDSHANLESSSNRKIYKYFFKYMTKGKDEARYGYCLGKSYKSSCDVAWRVFEFEVTAREPAVQQLPDHL
ncbi:putative helicase, partial [Operophtera brumata]